MKKNIFFMIMLIFLFLIFYNFINPALLSGKPYDFIPADHNIKFISKSDVTVLPEKFLREYDPVTIFFRVSQKKEAPCSEDNPSKYIITDFKQSGEYRWIDDKTLQLRPESQWF
ncbi:hypothetical protein KA977_08220, partial [Candidatus Dependentiae bacterium]|nr:hypothetical protein [Candidatus Dependentiae bacterium]